MNYQPSRRKFLTKSALAATSLLAAGGSVGTAAAPTSAGRRIGFVDRNLDNFHSRTYLRILREDLEDEGFTVAGAFALEVEASRA